MSDRRHGGASPARLLAYEALERIEKRDAFAQDVIAKTIDVSDVSPADRAFATRLVLGVVSMKGSLDDVLDRCMRSPHDAKPDVRMALRISTYEIIYLGKSPHAAVDQGVELVRSVAPRAAGLANAVLRKVAAAKGEFPFGNPATDIDAFSLQEGFPAWLTRQLEEDLGRDDAMAFERASNLPAPVFVFENGITCAPGAVAAAADALGGGEEIEAVCGVPLPACTRLSDRRAVSAQPLLGLLDGGCALVSDASAQAVASLCARAAAAGNVGRCDDVAQLFTAASPTGARPSVLELCSGRGTKTVMIQAGIQQAAGAQAQRYVCVDNVEFKGRLLLERAKAFGVSVSEALCAQIGEGDEPIAGGAFDVVFLDAPCSGLGTLRRHPEIRWRVTPDVIAQDALRDVSLLRHAAASVRPGGFLVYATCTVACAEDERAVEAFLASDAGSRFERVSVFGRDFLRVPLVEGGPDAHFCAVMLRAD